MQGLQENRNYGGGFFERRLRPYLKRKSMLENRTFLIN